MKPKRCPRLIDGGCGSEPCVLPAKHCGMCAPRGHKLKPPPIGTQMLIGDIVALGKLSKHAGYRRACRRTLAILKASP